MKNALMVFAILGLSAACGRREAVSGQKPAPLAPRDKSLQASSKPDSPSRDTGEAVGPIRATIPLALTASKFYQSENQVVGNSLILANPKNTVLVIYNHGSIAESEEDPCLPDDEKYTPLGLISQLDGMQIGEMAVTVFSFCTPSKVGEYNGGIQRGEPKIEKRAREIGVLVDTLVSAGMPARQIVLMGHSAGGWASLKVASKRSGGYGAVIAFNPAFAGVLNGRDQGWWNLRKKEGDKLKAAESLDALVYVVEEDEFERPQDLAFLQNVPDVTYRYASAHRDFDCSLNNYHLLVFDDCFASEYAHIEGYIKSHFVDTNT
jgi:hypothetical protein